jgi:riboflavin kinase/FMN adenylyltransferase
LAAHDLVQASALLGRAYSMSGKVVRGNQLGRQLGVPTANINIGHYTLALSGVYAVTVEGLGAIRQGVANIGVRPTVAGVHKPILEVHLFDFEEEIYAREIKVVFQHYVRAEQKFNSLDELKTQIHTDIKTAKHYFNNKE